MTFLNGLRDQNRISSVVASGQVCSGMAFSPLLMKQLYYSDAGVISHVHKHISQNGRKIECWSHKEIFVKNRMWES
jgi:hypothetical protein